MSFFLLYFMRLTLSIMADVESFVGVIWSCYINSLKVIINLYWLKITQIFNVLFLFLFSMVVFCDNNDKEKKNNLWVIIMKFVMFGHLMIDFHNESSFRPTEFGSLGSTTFMGRRGLVYYKPKPYNFWCWCKCWCN